VVGYGDKIEERLAPKTSCSNGFGSEEVSQVHGERRASTMKERPRKWFHETTELALSLTPYIAARISVGVLPVHRLNACVKALTS
jgi:hypothetical protein